MNMRRNKAQKTRKNKRQMQLIAHESDPYTVIPRHITQVTRDWTLRFLAVNGHVNAAFLITELAQMMGVIALTAVTSVFFSNCFRLKKIKMWSLTNAIGTPTTISLAWPNQPVAGSNFISGPPKTQSDTSSSVDRYAYIESKPPSRDSPYYGKWWDSLGSSTAVILTYPAGTVLEFSFQWFIDDFGVLAAGPAIIAATPGEVYHVILHDLDVEQPLNSISP